MATKPPLGLIPERLWKEKRLQELTKAMARYEPQICSGNLDGAQDAIDLISQWAKEIVDLGLSPSVRF